MHNPATVLINAPNDFCSNSVKFINGKNWDPKYTWAVSVLQMQSNDVQGVFVLFILTLAEWKTGQKQPPVESFLAVLIFVFPMIGMCVSLPCQEPLW